MAIRDRILQLAATAVCAIGLASVASPASAAAQEHACSAPAELTRLDQALARTSDRLAKGRPLKIVAFGSSSTEGVGASSRARSYPSRLEAELRARLPGRDIVVVNRGVGGEDAREMLARLYRSVLLERPDLVLWQVGTNAVLEDLRLAGETALIRAGLQRLAAAGIDVILIDPQYAPKVIMKARAAGMVALLESLGQQRGVAVFHRFSIMRHWRQDQQIPFAQFVSADGLHMNDWSYDCTARLLADAIVEAAARPVPTASAAARGRRKA